MDSIIQWNRRGFRRNCNELKLLVSPRNSFAVCLQEPYIKNTDGINVDKKQLHTIQSTCCNRKWKHLLVESAF